MKTRTTLVGTPGYHQYLLSNTGVISNPTTFKSPSVLDRERLIESQGHPFWWVKSLQLRKRPKLYKGKNPQKLKSSAERIVAFNKRQAYFKLLKASDVGGTFKAHKVLCRPAMHHLHDVQPLIGQRLFTDGVFKASGLSTSLTQTVFPTSDSEMDVLGTDAIARVLPTNPLSNMGQFLIELRDLPRAFDISDWKRKARKFRSLAQKGSDEYLNVAFGWVPFVNDIMSFTDVSLDFQKHITQYARDSGKHVRRRYHYPIETTVTSQPTIAGNPQPSWPFAAGGGVVNSDIVDETVRWFSGSFTYYLPPLDGSTLSYFNRYYAYASKLYGLRLSPDLLWKVAPWSWAADWVLNTGSVIRNWDAFHNQGLVMHYGYMMEAKIRRTVWTCSGYKLYTMDPSPPLTDLRTEIFKSRRKATPYGFGLNPASFSPFQQGIITALGINRLARGRGP